MKDGYHVIDINLVREAMVLPPAALTDSDGRAVACLTDVSGELSASGSGERSRTTS
jgi:hypothetical protein